MIAIKQWTVYVKLASGETIPVEIENISPVRVIKEYIQTRDGITPARQVLKVITRNHIFKLALLIITDCQETNSKFT